MSNKVLITKLLFYFNILLVLSDNIILPQIYKKCNFFIYFYINFIFPNGYGSIYKKKDKRRKPWVVIVTTGYDNEGKQKRKIIGYESSQANALKLLSDYHNNPYDLDLKNITFEYIWEEIEKEINILVKEGKMSDSNLKCLSLTYKNHLQLLHKQKLLELKYKYMQDIINNIDAGYTTKGYAKTICKKVFDKAINVYDLPISNNSANRISIGKKEKSEKHKPFTDEEVSIL